MPSALVRVLPALALALVPAAVRAQVAPLVAYDDQLRDGFADWSWATHDLASATRARGGARSISFEPDGWSALYLHRAAGIDPAQHETLTFSVHGGATGGQAIRVGFLAGGAPVATVLVADAIPGGLTGNAWHDVAIDLDDAGVTQVLDGVWFQADVPGDQPTAWIDEVGFAPRTGTPPPPTTIDVTVSPMADRRPIDPLVYGVNFPPAGGPAYPLVRWGGNSTTRYSWEDDVSNRASDWFFMNIENPDPGTLPSGSSSDRFVDDAVAAGAEIILTVPTIGWTPVDRTRRWGFSVATYGPQQQTECTASGGAPWCNPDAGNGLTAGGAPIAGNDPADTSRPIGPDFVTRWMDHLEARVGGAADGGVRYVALDNEPMLWSSTHRDVHPQRLGYAELWQRTVEYATAVKAQDPDVKVLGPDSWGWCDYFWSDADGCGVAGPDYTAHGPLLEWYLRQVAAHELATGARLVDVLDVHYYPQSPGVALSGDESAATSALRLRSLKSLYDPTYRDESWIADLDDDHVRLIPRLRALIDAHAPGLELAITEYSWGNDDGLSSALAQVEALAIFGREGVDLATRWVAPERDTLVEDAFRLYLDYDGAGARVLGDSVRALSANVDDVGAYAIDAPDPDDRTFLVLVNKATAPREVRVDAGAVLSGDVALFGLGDVGDARLGSRGAVTPAGSTFTLTMPARTARLAVMTAGCVVPGVASELRVSRPTASTVRLAWADAAGATDHVVRADVPSGAFATIDGTALAGASGLSLALPSGALRAWLVAGRNACGEGDLRAESP